MKELARRIFQKAADRGLVDGDQLEFNHVDIYDDDVKERIPSVEKAQEDFDWDPEIRLDEALDRCISNLNEIYDVEIPK
jgi:nucleoside-diphosphate-sugar epimerase